MKIDRKKLDEYLQFYNLNLSGIEHAYRFLPCNNEEIFIQTFTPSQPVGVVLVVHGYLDHSGSMNQLIQFLTTNHYKVIAYDLQGHGLSSGMRANISDFSDYVRIFKTISKQYQTRTKLPFHVIAHSTGGAIVIDYLLHNVNTFQNVILISPLVRSYGWRFSKLGYYLASPFLKELSRVFKYNSSDKDYLAFVKKDPLQYHKLPLTWLGALFKWNDRVRKVQKSQERVYVIQGTKDQTVAWKYNLKFIQRKFPQAQVKLVRGGRHQLVNENSKLLQKTFTVIEEILSVKKE